jgi:hypothetical protein
LLQEGVCLRKRIVDDRSWISGRSIHRLLRPMRSPLSRHKMHSGHRIWMMMSSSTHNGCPSRKSGKDPYGEFTDARRSVRSTWPRRRV